MPAQFVCKAAPLLASHCKPAQPAHSGRMGSSARARRRARGADSLLFGFDAGRGTLQPQRMNSYSNRIVSCHKVSRRAALSMIVLAAALTWSLPVVRGAAADAERAWRPLPLITDGQVDSGGVHVG